MYYAIYLSPWLALLFWLAFILMVKVGGTGKVMVATVALNGALFWTANVAARTFFGYVGPSTLFSTWGVFFYLHVGFSIVAMASVLGAYNATVYARLAPVRRRLNVLTRNPHPH